MLIVRGVNIFPSAVEEIVRRFPSVEEFQIEVFRREELDEIRVLLDCPDGVDVTAVQEALRRGIGLRVDVAAVVPRSLPRYELKARRVVRGVPPGGVSAPDAGAPPRP
jgi:phenylacetate-CoA ligase